MPRRFEWPELYPGSYIELPDEWTGQHSRRRQEAVEKLTERGVTGELHSFGVALALLEDWDLPGLTGPPDKWTFEEMPLGLIKGVNLTVWSSYNGVMAVPKASSGPSPSGPEGKTKEADGDSEAIQ